jgi:hypothetical protein
MRRLRNEVFRCYVVMHTSKQKYRPSELAPIYWKKNKLTTLARRALTSDRVEDAGNRLTTAEEPPALLFMMRATIKPADFMNGDQICAVNPRTHRRDPILQRKSGSGSGKGHG